MTNEVNQEQKSGYGSINTQVGIQNNHNGLTIEDAIQIARQLFAENFPKLQQIAHNIAEDRVAHFMTELFASLSKDGFCHYESFAEPDIQYVLYEAQKNYARMGAEELMKLLISLLNNRVNCKRSLASVSINEAIIATSKILPKHYDYITLLFILHRTKHQESEISSTDDVKKDMEDNIVPFTNFWLNYCDALQLISSGVANKRDIPYGLGGLLKSKYGNCVVNYKFEDFILLVPEIAKLSELNTNAFLGLMELSNSGVAIALSNYNLKKNECLSVSEWIK